MRARPTPAVRALVAAAALLSIGLSGCAPSPQPEPDDWTLEPITWDTTLRPLGTADEATADGERTDVAFGMSMLAADGDGGFWAMSSGSWLHVDGDGRTTARLNTEADDPLTRIDSMAALTSTSLITSRNDGAPVLAVLDTETMSLTDLPGSPDDFAFGEVAARDGQVFAVRYQPAPQGYVDYEVLHIDPTDGTRTVLHRAPLSPDDALAAAPDLPPVDVDVDGKGRIHIADPNGRFTLDADGTVLSTTTQTAEFPLVAARPNGDALWWGGASDASPIDAAGVTIGGSDAARAAISRAESCGGGAHSETLTFVDADGAQSLPFLCGANAAVWTGTAWVVALGGEADGVLVRLTPPAREA